MTVQKEGPGANLATMNKSIVVLASFKAPRDAHFTRLLYSAVGQILSPLFPTCKEGNLKMVNGGTSSSSKP